MHVVCVATLALWIPAAILVGWQWLPLLIYGYRPHVPPALALVASIASEVRILVPRVSVTKLVFISLYRAMLRCYLIECSFLCNKLPTRQIFRSRLKFLIITFQAATSIPVLCFIAGDERLRAALLGRMRKHYALLQPERAKRYNRT